MAKKPKTLAPVHPNAGLEIAYQRKLEALVDEMARSVIYWISAAYRANEPEMAQDESSAAALTKAMRRLGSKWQRQFDIAAEELARWFAQAAANRSDAALRSILKKSGFTVQFRMTRAQNDVLQATIAENVALIKSIPQQYLTQVEGLVMRSVQAGRDIGALREEIQHQFGVTRRRAAFIARDQNNKASSMLSRVRYTELGITQARWVHSAGGRHPRPTHVQAGRDGVIYSVSEGWLDPAINKRIWPGTEPSCRCIARPVLPALHGSKG